MNDKPDEILGFDDAPVTTIPKCYICGECHVDGVGGHHCPEWDLIWVKPRDPEMEACTCQNQ